jgi:hypothetical protein
MGRKAGRIKCKNFFGRYVTRLDSPIGRWWICTFLGSPLKSPHAISALTAMWKKWTGIFSAFMACASTLYPLAKGSSQLRQGLRCQQWHMQETFYISRTNPSLL